MRCVSSRSVTPGHNAGPSWYTLANVRLAGTLLSTPGEVGVSSDCTMRVMKCVSAKLEGSEPENMLARAKSRMPLSITEASITRSS
eukprot:709684-Pyramimonas_sp.AAC.1